MQGEFRVTNLPPATTRFASSSKAFRRWCARRQFVWAESSRRHHGHRIAVRDRHRPEESPLVDTERAGLSVNINNTALTTVPVTTSRRFQDVWLMVPGVYIRPDTQEATGSERRTSVDGMDVTDPFGGDIFAVNLNYEDVEIKALGAEASDGASMVGQFMNVVTKSGGNNVHGSFALFMIPQRFNDSNVEGIAPNNRRDIQPDMTLGGPILRQDLVLRIVSADSAGSNRQQRTGAARAARQPVLRQGHHAASHQPSSCGDVSARPLDGGERGDPRDGRTGAQLCQPLHWSQQRDDADYDAVGVRHASPAGRWPAPVTTG